MEQGSLIKTQSSLTKTQAQQDRSALIAKGRDLFRQPCDFVMGVVDFDHLPSVSCLEIAFAGRSNVGKSSLINALTSRRRLARFSNTPGRTRELNFFNLADLVWLVDLPGYGYARAPKKDIERWTQLTRDYLVGRPGLRRIYLLIDSRHGLKEADLHLIKELDRCAVSYQVVLTKGDKLKKNDLEKTGLQVALQLRKHPAAYPEVIATSSQKNMGLDVLRAEIMALLLA